MFFWYSIGFLEARIVNVLGRSGESIVPRSWCHFRKNPYMAMCQSLQVWGRWSKVSGNYQGTSYLLFNQIVSDSLKCQWKDLFGTGIPGPSLHCHCVWFHIIKCSSFSSEKLASLRSHWKCGVMMAVAMYCTFSVVLVCTIGTLIVDMSITRKILFMMIIRLD